MLLVALLLVSAPIAGLAQQNVGIGTTAPDVSAALDIVSSSKGALLPRVADATALATPATGLLVFQTNAPAGFYYNAGTAGAPSWQQLATAAGATLTANNGLTKTGSTVALGGTLSQATSIAQAGNAFSLTGGNVGIGTPTPTQRLDVDGGILARNHSAISNQGAYLQWNRSNNDPLARGAARRHAGRERARVRHLDHDDAFSPRCCSAP